MTIDRVRLDRFELIAGLADLLVGAGYSPSSARTTARHLVEAERLGRPSHGLRLLARYVEEARGQTNTGAEPAIIERSAARLVVDARMGPGHPMLEFALREAGSLAAQAGASLLWVTNLRHVGALSLYLDPLVENGMSALLTVASAGDPRLALVAAPGTAKRVLGSNPIAIAICERGEPVLRYDGALAATSFFEIERARAMGTKLDAPAIVARDLSLTDAPEAFDDGGAIAALGGGRGFGLSLAMALFAQAGGGRPESASASAFAVIVDGAHVRPGAARTAAAVRLGGGHVPGDGRMPGPGLDLIVVERADLAPAQRLGLRVAER